MASGIQIDAMELLKSIMSQLGVNHTFFFQLTLVVLAYLFLSRLLFKPVLASLLLRVYKVEGLKISADDMSMEHDKLVKQHKLQWREYETRAKASSDKIIAEAKLKAEKIITDSEHKASDNIKIKRQEIVKTTEKLSTELSNSSAQIEQMIKTKLFGV